MTTSPCWDLQIGPTIATLTPLHRRGIVAPPEWMFNRVSRVETDGTGIPRGFGYAVAEWRFDILSQRQLNVFLGFLSGDAVMGVSLFIWTYTDAGVGGDANLERFQGVMHRPVDQNDKSIVPNSAGEAYNDVVIKFSHLEAA